MTPFDRWYSDQPGYKDRDLARRAFEAGRASAFDPAALKDAQDIVQNEHMIFDTPHCRRVMAALINGGNDAQRRAAAAAAGAEAGMNQTAEVHAAVALAWSQFQTDTKLAPDRFTDSERMIFQAAFVAGANWSLERLKNRMQEPQP